jgi:hypothetical protein
MQRGGCQIERRRRIAGLKLNEAGGYEQEEIEQEE